MRKITLLSVLILFLTGGFIATTSNIISKADSTKHANDKSLFRKHQNNDLEVSKIPNMETNRGDSKEESIAIQSNGWGSEWSDPEVICDFPMAGNKNYAVTSDPLGNIHLIWTSHILIDSRYNIEMYYVKRDRMEWSNPQRELLIDSTLFRHYPPDIVSDSSGNLHAVSIARILNSPGIYHFFWDGNEWTYSVILTNSGARLDDGLRIACDNEDNLHLVWAEASPYWPDIFYKYWDGSVWSSSVQISPDWPDIYYLHPLLNIDSLNHPHVAMAAIGFGSAYTRWNGIEWTEPTIPGVGGGGGDSSGPKYGMEIDILDNPHIIARGVSPWIDYSHTFGIGSSWTPPVNISNSPEHSTYIRTASDDSGNIHAIWQDSLPLPQTGSQIVYRRFDGLTWSEPEIVFNFDRGVFPIDIVIDGFNYVHVIILYYDHENHGYVLDLIKQADIDNDGLPDDWENQNFGRLGEAGGDDFDNDGLTNLEEFEAYTNPVIEDSDYDGYYDKQELHFLTNPNDPNEFPNEVISTPKAWMGSVMFKGLIFTFGGGISNDAQFGGSEVSSVEAYDPMSNTWIEKTHLGLARAHLTAEELKQKFYTIGGSIGVGTQPIGQVEEYDPITNTWTNKASLNMPRWKLASSVFDGKIYTFGGGTSGNQCVPSDVVEEYDPTLNIWTIKNPMPSARWGACSETMDGLIYVIGGSTKCPHIIIGPSSVVEIYDPLTDSWSFGAPMPTARWDFATAVVNGKLYAIGGWEPYGQTALPTVEEYDPNTNSWSTKSPMPTARTGLCAEKINQSVYVVGGNTGTEVTNLVEVYDVISNKWSGPYPYSEWEITTIDAEGDIGKYSSLQFDNSGLPGISYGGWSIWKYAHYSGSSWTNETVGTRQGLWNTSLAFDNQNRPSFSSIRIPWDSNWVYYAHFDGVTWNIDPIDITSGGYASHAFDSLDRPVIVYQYRYNPGSSIIKNNLRYATFDGANWNSEEVYPNLGTGGFYNSLDYDSIGNPGISFYKAYNYSPSEGSDLLYSYFNGTTWVTVEVDTNLEVGLWTSLAFDTSDNPGISYYDKTNGNLKYAHFNGIIWDIEIVDSIGDVGEYTSLVFDGAEFPCISYYDRTNGDLKLAQFIDSYWVISIVDSDGDVGQFTSIALDPRTGSPVISYYDVTHGDLKIAFWESISISDPFINTLSKYSGQAGEEITIYGSNFGSTQGSITSNGVATPITTWTDTQIIASVPVEATSGPIVVHTLDGRDSNGVLFTVTIPPVPQPPIASFEYSPLNPLTDEEVTFDATGSYDPDGTIEQYLWSFYYTESGEGGSWDEISETTQFTYPSPGNYLVELTVVDNSQASSSISKILRVDNPPQNELPVASFSFSPTSPRAGEEVILNASDSYDPDGEIKYYEWDLDGDGSYDGSTRSQVIIYYWDEGGTNSVRLRVTDENNATDIFAINITIEPNSWWDKIKKFFADSVVKLGKEEKKRFELIKAELSIRNIGHSDDFFADPDFYWYSDQELLNVLKSKFEPPCELTYENLIIETLHDMKLADSIANRSWSINPELEKLFLKMADFNIWAETGLLISKEAMAGLIEVAGGSGIGVSCILMLPDIYQAIGGLKLLDDIFYRRALWHYFQLRPDYSPMGAFELSPVPVKYDNEDTNMYFETLWINYGGTHISVGGGLKLPFRESIITQLRNVLLSGLEKYAFARFRITYLMSPGEVSVSDSQGNITGSFDDEAKEEILDSAYDDERKAVLIYSPDDSYFWRIQGTNEGTYGLNIISVEEGVPTFFTSTTIPITSDEVHQYIIDWDALSQGENGTTVKIDAEGDGTFETVLVTGGTFSLVNATINLDPDTLVLKSMGQWITSFIELPEGNDVSNIDISSIELKLGDDLLASIAVSAPHDVGDYDLDNIPDLMVKFDRATIIQYLKNNNLTSGNFVFSVIGKVGDKIFAGTDAIRIIE